LVIYVRAVKNVTCGLEPIHEENQSGL